jgi:hypothetical protein
MPVQAVPTPEPSDRPAVIIGKSAPETSTA